MSCPSIPLNSNGAMFEKKQTGICLEADSPCNSLLPLPQEREKGGWGWDVQQCT